MFSFLMHDIVWKIVSEDYGQIVPWQYRPLEKSYFVPCMSSSSPGKKLLRPLVSRGRSCQLFRPLVFVKYFQSFAGDEMSYEVTFFQGTILPGDNLTIILPVGRGMKAQSRSSLFPCLRESKNLGLPAGAWQP